MGKPTRRDFLKLATGTVAALGLGAVPVAEAPEPELPEPVSPECSETPGLLWMKITMADGQGGHLVPPEYRQALLDRLLEREFIEGDPKLVPVGIVGEVRVL